MHLLQLVTAWDEQLETGELVLQKSGQRRIWAESIDSVDWELGSLLLGSLVETNGGW